MVLCDVSCRSFVLYPEGDWAKGAGLPHKAHLKACWGPSRSAGVSFRFIGSRHALTLGSFWSYY